MPRLRRPNGTAATPKIAFLQPSRVSRDIASQRYYLMALDEVAAVNVANQALLARVFRTPERKAHAAFVGSLLRARSPLSALRPIAGSGQCGRYVARFPGREVRFAIDAADAGVISDRETLEWSDLYFKANRWPTLEYPEKVLPLINSNGWLDARRIERLRALRDSPKDIDVAFISNVWGGREHNIRLFEQLSRLEARTDLQAIFPPGSDPEETRGFEDRLRAVNVHVREGHMPREELSSVLARSRIVFIRSGKYCCIPWRMLDLLAMGACVVYDSALFPQWYEPLRANVHYVECGVDRPPDTSPAPPERYEQIVPTIEELLSDESRMAGIRAANADYFDTFAAPRPLGRHIVAQFEARL